MGNIRRITLFFISSLVVAGLWILPAFALEESAIALSFDPADDHSERYMFQLMMMGAHISPGIKDEMIRGEFMIGTVYKDTVVESMYGLNRHAITFYEYHVRSLQSPFGRDRNDPRFGGTPWPAISDGEGEGEGGGEGGGGGGGSMSVTPSLSTGFIGDLGLPSGGSNPLQGGEGGGGGGGGGEGGGGGGGSAGGTGDTSINLDTILITNIDYMTNKRGEVLDIGGLDVLRKVSKNRLLTSEESDRSYVDINISHIFEWTHLLYLPEEPVYKEDIWFHSYPLHIPGLPSDQPIMTKFMYKLIDFRTINSRKVAVIDMSGVAEWNLEWDDRNDLELTEFKSWGNMGITSRYWFDYEAGEIFGIERPPFYDWQYRRSYSELNFYWPTDGHFQMRYPGLIINWEFFYNTRVTDISGKPRLKEAEPVVLRRYIILNLFCQLEAE